MKTEKQEPALPCYRRKDPSFTVKFLYPDNVEEIQDFCEGADVRWADKEGNEVQAIPRFDVDENKISLNYRGIKSQGELTVPSGAAFVKQCVLDHWRAIVRIYKDKETFKLFYVT